MKNVRCKLVPTTNTVFVFRDARLVAMVTEVEGEPRMVFYGGLNNAVEVSFNDLEIIQDNWNQLQEYRKEIRVEEDEKPEKSVDIGAGI